MGRRSLKQFIKNFEHIPHISIWTTDTGFARKLFSSTVWEALGAEGSSLFFSLAFVSFLIYHTRSN